MGAQASSTGKSQNGLAEEAGSKQKLAFPADIITNELLRRLHDDLRALDTEVVNMKVEKTGGVSRQYIDFRLQEIAEGLHGYNKARATLFKKTSSEQQMAPGHGLSKQSKTDVGNLMNKKSDEIARQRTMIKRLQERNDDLTLRLSALVGDKLVKGNPNVADLSDPNRPTKLGELYGELYNNEYTDAMEQLRAAGLSDIDTVKTLRLTLLSTFSFCQRKASQLVNTVERAVTVLFDDYQKTVLEKGGDSMRDEIYIAERWRIQEGQGQDTPHEEGTTSDLGSTVLRTPVNIKEKLEEFRKEASYAMLPMVQKAYLKARWDKTCVGALKPFIRKGLLITWYMVVQSPPLMFLPSEVVDKKKFDLGVYKVYTKAGQFIDYVVWPTMCLHDGGPILYKGIAQGCD